MSTLVFFGLYLIAWDKFTKTDFDRLFQVALFAAIPVSLVAISQHESLIRVYSTFGQANWLAQFMAMLLPLANYLFFTDPHTIVWLVVSVLMFAGLWFTYSLSGILGYGLAFCLLLYLFRKQLFLGFENRTNVYKMLFLVIVCELIAVTNLGVFRLRLHDASEDLKKMFTVAHFVPSVYAQESSSNTQGLLVERNLSDPGYIRGGIWLGTKNLIFSSAKIALIGTGPETFPYAFQKFRPRELNYSSEWNFVFNKPHNYFLEVASEQGLIGLAIYGYLCYILFKKLEKKYVPMLCALLITNIFGWPTVFTTFMFWLFLASLKEDAKV